MRKVISATTSPVKIQAILRALEEIFREGSCHIGSVAVESSVPEQPFGNQGTRAGARNRVDSTRRLHSQVDFRVTIEAGIDDDATFSWVVIDNGIRRGKARSATLPLPTIILDRVRKGEALNPVISSYTGIDETGRKGGAVGVFTAGKLTRPNVYYQAVTLALSPFHNMMYLWHCAECSIVGRIRQSRVQRINVSRVTPAPATDANPPVQI